jgi:hypothetical protein
MYDLYGITFGSGDFVSLFSLFLDNLSTLPGFAGAIMALSSTSTVLEDIVYTKIIPAAGIMLFFRQFLLHLEGHSHAQQVEQGIHRAAVRFEHGRRVSSLSNLCTPLDIILIACMLMDPVPLPHYNPFYIPKIPILLWYYVRRLLCLGGTVYRRLLLTRRELG